MDTLYTKAEIESTEKGALAIASTAVQDRHGEIVTVEGWDLKNFKKDPVLLWAHDHYEPAIGVAKNIKIDGEGKKARLVFEPVFHEATDRAKAIKTLFEQGVLNSFSVGFRPLEMDGATYLTQELLEISAVNVPANPDARMMAYKALKDKGFTDEVAKSVGAFVEAVKRDERYEALVAEVQELKESYLDVVKGLQHLNPHGRKSEIVTTRLALHKVIARASDKMLETGTKQVSLVKVIKRANEKLIVDQKQELTQIGKNQRAS